MLNQVQQQQQQQQQQQPQQQQQQQQQLPPRRLDVHHRHIGVNYLLNQPVVVVLATNLVLL